MSLRVIVIVTLEKATACRLPNDQAQNRPKRPWLATVVSEFHKWINYLRGLAVVCSTLDG